MTINANVLHRQSHRELGQVLQRDATVILDRWCRWAVEEQPNAQRLHDAALRDHLPALLQALGRSLAETDDAETSKHRLPAEKHGDQRWEDGWSLNEVVRDYQILRYVIVEYLEEALDRPLQGHEVMALGLALDEAISASVDAYVQNRAAYARRVEEEQAAHDRETEALLRRHAAALQEANRHKDEFLAVLGHELRNPLAPLRNALQVLALQSPDPALVNWARNLMERQVQHMAVLVDDLLDVTRIAQGKITLRRERLDLVRLVRETAEDRRGSLVEAGLELELDLVPGPLWVEGDPTRLAQAVGNLVQNALKFTDRGGRVTIRVAPEEKDHSASVTVQDTGIGIEAELLPRLFDHFMQGDRSVNRSRGGLGLGLALVKGLIELHGGEVQAFSAGPGQGAQFTLRLPLVD